MLKTAKTIRVVSAWDPAIDRDATGVARLEEYAGKWDEREQRFVTGGTRDVSLLVFKPGVAPVWFYVRRISLPSMRVVESASSDEEMRERAFMVGVERIENIVVDGAPVARAPKTKRETAVGEEYWWSETEIEELFNAEAMDRPTWKEIGGIALTRASLRRGSAPRYLLPRSLGEDWGQLIASCRAAESNGATALPSSGAPAEPLATANGELGAGHTVATATASLTD